MPLAPVASPASTAPPRTKTPSTASMTSAIAIEAGVPRRRFRGTSQTVSIATWAARTAPSPAHSARTIPMASVRPEPSIWPTLFRICVPITGNWASAESRSWSWRSGRSRRTIPATDVKTMSRGNNEKNP